MERKVAGRQNRDDGVRKGLAETCTGNHSFHRVNRATRSLLHNQQHTYVQLQCYFTTRGFMRK